MSRKSSGGIPALARTRLTRQYRALLKNPVESIVAKPNDKNLLEFHYVLTGQTDSPFEGGRYHGVVKFPPEYPMQPPAIKMLTPNGRFRTGTRLCLSISDFHPDTWNPVWGIDTILLGLHSFMLEDTPTVGSITTPDEHKRKFALNSMAFNCRNPTFRRLFPELVEEFKQANKAKLSSKAAATAAAGGSGNASRGGSGGAAGGGGGGPGTGGGAVAGAGGGAGGGAGAGAPAVDDDTQALLGAVGDAGAPAVDARQGNTPAAAPVAPGKSRFDLFSMGGLLVIVGVLLLILLVVLQLM